MSDIKLFKLNQNSVTELESKSVDVEKSLQTLMENHLEDMLGIKFLASEYSTGKQHGGRIDSLGLDEHNCPVIIEYKRGRDENVINQGLYYLNWLMDHKAEFKLMVMEKLSKEQADGIEWGSPRLLCIAGDFTKYDKDAVQQIKRNIELIIYRRYDEDLMLLELVNVVSASNIKSPSTAGKSEYKTYTDKINELSGELADRFENITAFIMDLGDDVQMKTLQSYLAFKRLRNFATIEFQTKNSRILLYVDVESESVRLEDGFTTDLGKIGNTGKVRLKIEIYNKNDFEKAKLLILRAYENS